MFESERIYRSWNCKWAGRTAFQTRSDTGRSEHACYVGGIHNLQFKAHRVAWAIVYGKWPGEVDHINGDPLDNRLANLRSVTHIENGQNVRTPSDNKSGRIGVSWNSAHERWLAAIVVNRKRIYLGEFARLADAVTARERAERRYGFHANHGRRKGD